MIRKFSPTSFNSSCLKIHHASTIKKCVLWNGKTPCTNEKTSSNSHTQNRHGEVKPQPTALSKYNKGVLHTPHFACTRQFAASHWTIPPKRTKQFFIHEQNYARTQRFEQASSNNRIKRIPCKTALVTTNETAPCTNNKFQKLAFNNYIARCYQKTHHVYERNYAMFVAWIALR